MGAGAPLTIFWAVTEDCIIASLTLTAQQGSKLLVVLGGVVALLLGALTAMEFDQIVAIGLNLARPVGQTALLQAAQTIGLAGITFWVVCAAANRMIHNAAVAPYLLVASRLESLVDGCDEGPSAAAIRAAGARRILRAGLTLHAGRLEGARVGAMIQARYDALARLQDEERRLFVKFLTGDASAPVAKAVPESSGSPAAFTIPTGPDGKVHAARASAGVAQSSQIIDLLGRFRTPG